MRVSERLEWREVYDLKADADGEGYWYLIDDWVKPGRIWVCEWRVIGKVIDQRSVVTASEWLQMSQRDQQRVLNTANAMGVPPRETF